MGAPGAAWYMRNRPEIFPLLEILYQHEEGVLFADLICELHWSQQELISMLRKLQGYGVVEARRISASGCRKAWYLKASFFPVVRTLLYPREGAEVAVNAVKAGVL